MVRWRLRILGQGLRWGVRMEQKRSTKSGGGGQSYMVRKMLNRA